MTNPSIFDWFTIDNVHKAEEFATAAGVSLSGIVWILKIASFDLIDAIFDSKNKLRERREERDKNLKRREQRHGEGNHKGVKG